MEALELVADVREAIGKQAKRLRQQGLVPAVVYGREVETVAIQINEKTLNKVLDQAGTHQLISLKIGKSKPRLTLARDIQRDVIKRNYVHVDFYVVKMDEKVTAEVPLLLIGEAPAVKDLGGVLTHGISELEIECLPGDLISSVEVSVADLVDINDMITVADLKVPDAVTILSDPDSVVAKIEAPRKVAEEVEEEAVEVTAGAEPEVLTAARDEDEE